MTQLMGGGGGGGEIRGVHREAAFKTRELIDGEGSQMERRGERTRNTIECRRRRTSIQTEEKKEPSLSWTSS